MSGSAIGTLNSSLIFSILENNGHIKQENMIVVLSQMFNVTSSLKGALRGG
jgi:hypothetical protein